MVTQIEWERATKRAKAFAARAPKAIAARYDRRLDRVIVHLNTNLEIAFSPRDAQGLEDAQPSQLETIEITPTGSASISQRSMLICICPRCWRDFLAQENEWPQLGQRRRKSKVAKKLAAKRTAKLAVAREIFAVG